MAGRSSTPEERQALGKRLREAAQAAGFTSDSIAERLGVQGGSVRGWWVGRNEPSIERIKDYADLVGVSAGWLLFGIDKPMGASGPFQEWRLRFANLVARGMSPLEALDAIMGSPHWNTSGIPDERLTSEERELLGAPGTGEAMRKTLGEMAKGQWEALAPDEQELVLQLIEKLARDRGEPKP